LKLDKEKLRPWFLLWWLEIGELRQSDFFSQTTTDRSSIENLCHLDNPILWSWIYCG